MRSILLIFLGGGAGSALRYLTSVFFGRFATTLFPLAIFSVNMAGCFLIGLFIGIFERYAVTENADWRLLLITGFCGGYTTFSTFSAENLTLIQSGHYGLAIAYITASVVLGIIAVWTGFWIAK